MARGEIIQRSAENGFRPWPTDANHMIGVMGIRGANTSNHHRGFKTPSGQWLEIHFTTDITTGAVVDIFEDTRGLNRK